MKILRVAVLMVPCFVLAHCLAQNPISGVLQGKFIQLRFIGQTFLDDAHEVGGGNILTRWDINAKEKSYAEQFIHSDTLFLVDDITYHRKPCISEPEDCQELSGTERLCKMLNRHTLGPKSIQGVEFCLVELTVEVVRVENIGMALPNLDCQHKNDPCFIIPQMPTYILKCMGVRDTDW